MTATTRHLYVAAIASAKVGTGFFFLINTWLMVELTGRPSSAAISLIMTVLPSLLLSPLIGVIADRGQPSRLAYRAEFMRWAVLAAYGILYGCGRAGEVVGYAISFCIAFGNETQVIAWRAALTQAVDRDQLLRLNALTVVGGQSGQIFGAAASGFVLAAIGAPLTIALASATYLASACFSVLVSRRLQATSQTQGAAARHARYFDDVRAGFLHIVARPQIAFFYGLILANMTVIFGINAMLASFVRDDLLLDAAAFGKIDAGYALGAIFSGLWIVPLSRRFGRQSVLAGGLVTAWLGLLAFSQCHGLVVAAASYVLLGISFQTSVISLSAAQAATAAAYQGRVGATFNAMTGLVGLAVYVGVALVADQHLYRMLYLAQATAILALVPLVILASRRPSIRRYLNPPEPGSLKRAACPTGSKT